MPGVAGGWYQTRHGRHAGRQDCRGMRLGMSARAVHRPCAGRARVLVTEIDPICALQAAMEGYEVVRLQDVVSQGDLFVTCTGNCDVILAEHLAAMKDHAIVCNIGHFDNEIDVAGLKSWPGIECVRIKDQVERYIYPDGHSIILLAEGRLVNLGCAAIQLCHELFVLQSGARANSAGGGNWTLASIASKKLDEEVARLHLEKLGVKLSKLSERQAAYIGVPVEEPINRIIIGTDHV